MEIMLNPEQWTLDLYNIEDGNEYKLSDYNIIVEHDNKVIILHTITWAIYVLTIEEFDNIIDNELMREYKVVVPIDLDELEIAHRVYLDRVTPADLPTLDDIESFIILTTTSCNARCFYCYEDNIEKNLTMDYKTAEDVVNFIKNRYRGNKINLEWFGGEPLLNKNIINYITKRLYDLNIDFKGSIITNGLLITDDVVESLEYWKIEHIQITIDGIQEEYNKIKNYVYTDIDAFLTLIGNIHNILEKTNKNINIRVNATNNNIFNIYNDILFLREEFDEYVNNKRISFNVATIHEYIQTPDIAIEGFWDEFYRLREIANVRTPNMRIRKLEEGFFNRVKFNYPCSSYVGKTFFIMPNGSLVRCGLIRKEDIYGDIYNGVTNQKVLEEWAYFDNPELEFCKKIKCSLYPMCPKFVKCESYSLCKEEKYTQESLLKAKEKLIKTYDYYNNIIKNNN